MQRVVLGGLSADKLQHQAGPIGLGRDDRVGACTLQFRHAGSQSRGLFAVGAAFIEQEPIQCQQADDDHGQDECARYASSHGVRLLVSSAWLR
jgi:hypothetical protein